MKTIIDADQRRISLDLRELLSYRDLLFTLAYRDLRVRYAQTYLGLLWSVIQPLGMLIAFNFVFTRITKVDTGGTPYILFALAGMLPWTYFSSLASQAGSSMLANRPMITKIYFPRLIIPLSKALVCLLDFLIGFVLLIVLFFVYGQPIHPGIVFLPVFLVLVVMAGLTAGIWFSALSVRYRDFQNILPFVMQFGLFLTPVAYPVSTVPAKLQFAYSLNPMAGIVEGFRWSLLGGPAPAATIYLGAGLIVTLFIAGIYFFRFQERTMVDAL